ncbi:MULTISPECIES: Hsp70 family protein [Vibrio]|uniref:Chaperone Hsp70 in DNA biosynthesis/cell division n=2 Tax=Vibrio alginolyticus TaxID=663 RepID=A0A2I3C0P1_VIBAX|nr:MULTISPECIES: Hsp70 family protein [Vibrio]AGV16334.1 chaperone Hsp70 in DNA biosynthesis/cell division [Vibrio alginolyticus NBRC 15630 = ATCC 17749]ELB1086735.1 Hsp70 family protein [Vibrio alginolyticus]ELB1510145.1 Hsp70 family protein [Vibrio alginolyticus]ELB1659307.1 Hsp70 family protein [Vibrio alginolyticus]MBO0204079.1 Hsp70 family protein [Vibrio alginolyticus]
MEHMNQENHSREVSVETQQTPKFSVGIDLGTTHCVMSFVDTHDEDARVEVMPIPQLTAPGTVETRSQLGSFLYQPHEHEMNPQSRVLPWSSEPKALVGAIARNLGSKTPIRLVASAKSWLCHAGVNRRDAFLPAGSPEEVEKVSPLRATELYLEHLKDAWNHTNPNHNLADQDVTITVPASFDPAARDLTAEAARNVGFVHLTLLEEPQAALYNWIDNSNDKWRDEVEVGDIVLVVDIGGGTTDLSLVEVTEDEGNLTLNRIAVGEHILLGGDNMDLALAYRLKMKLAQEGKELQPWQVQAMTHACRDAKEALLNDSELQSVPIVVPSRGSKLLGATLKTELTQEEVQQTLVDGFFPQVAITDHPVQRNRGALTQMGLPYAQDAGITRHIAAFLSKQANALSASGNGAEAAAQDFNPFANMPGMPGSDAAQSADFIKPTAILFNGGVLKSKLLATRLEDTINEWLIEADAEMAKRLTGVDLDLAVASGAAYYGSVRRGQGVRIRGGIASAYYVGIESAMPAIPGMAPPMEALCVAPFGMEEGSSVDVPSQEFGLIIGQPVNFQFFGSTVRRDDLAGTHLDYWAPEELEELPEIQVTLPVSEGRREGEVVPVTLASRVTELGTLYLEAIAADNGQKWHVEFDVREDAKSNSNEEE